MTLRLSTTKWGLQLCGQSSVTSSWQMLTSHLRSPYNSRQLPLVFSAEIQGAVSIQPCIIFHLEIACFSVKKLVLVFPKPWGHWQKGKNSKWGREAMRPTGFSAQWGPGGRKGQQCWKDEWADCGGTLELIHRMDGRERPGSFAWLKAPQE